ncbi:MAG: hypothetical protein PHD82_12835 [Candidatus Riflebacteria bacterium]|nr:hypothetical protein [Candidatus Riflebacteria bacterium]
MLSRNTCVLISAVFFMAAGLLFSGCNSDAGNPASVNLADSGNANAVAGPVSFQIVLPETPAKDTGSSVAIIRASSATDPQVTFKLVLVNAGNSGMPTSTMVKTVPVDMVSGTAVATFTSIPVCTCIGEIKIEGGSIDSYSEFHGALDLAVGVNNILRVVPVGSKLNQDFVTHVIRQVVATPILFGKATSGLAGQVLQAINTLDKASQTAYEDAVNLFARYVNVTVQIDTTEPSQDPSFDTVLEANRPTIAASYRNMTNSLAENSSLTPTQRVDTFMPEISDSFVNASGAAAKTDVRNVTIDRLTRYTVNKYTFIPVSHKVIDANTIEVTTYMAIEVTRKPGVTGGFEKVSTILSPNPVFTWTNEGGTWRITKGLPYLSSEVSF